MPEREHGFRFTTRHAEFDDVDALAQLHVLVWRHTYRLLAPQEAYAALDETKRRTHWAELLRRDPRQWQTIVAEQDGRLVGFGHAGPGSHDALAGAGEIVHLYIDPRSQGHGVGAELLSQMMKFLRATGWPTIKLAVVRGNEQALRFYERKGGRVVGQFIDGLLWRSDNLVVEFPLPD